MMQTWLLEYIETTTGRAQGGRRKVRRERCPRCRAIVLAGLDEDVLALDVKVDPSPLTDLGAVVAHLAGREVCSLIRGELHVRDQYSILDDRAPALAVHVCDESLPARPPPQALAGAIPTDPPF